MDKRFNFTKSMLEKLPPSSEGKRLYFYDTKVKGLSLSITTNGVKSFLVYKSTHGKPIRVTLGRFPGLTIEQARHQALDVLAELSKGINPNLSKHSLRASAKITLREVLKTYITVRKLKPRTVQDYQETMDETFKDWLDKPIRDLANPTLLQKRHAKRGESSPARANNAFRVLRALFNFAHSYYREQGGTRSIFLDHNNLPLLQVNPVKAALFDNRAWFKISRKRTYIKSHQLKDWFEAVMRLDEMQESQYNLGTTVRDYLLFLLMTGCRSGEAAQLKWQDVDLQDSTFDLIDPKNRETVTLPMSDYLTQILTTRFENSPESIYVFAGHDANNYIKECRIQMNKVIEHSGVSFTPHDLRRTFSTIAESLDISHYTIKRLLNHIINSDIDVTAGYIIPDVDRLRKATQKITDFILERAK